MQRYHMSIVLYQLCMCPYTVTLLNPSASTPIDIECAGTQFWDMGAIKRNDRCDSRINCIHKMSGQQI